MTPPRASRPAVSFEFFPPKTPAAETQLWAAIRALEIPIGAVLAAVGLHESPRFASHAGRSWVTDQSIDQVEAFYRRRWPSFRFFRSVAENGQQGGMQYLRPDRQGKLQPAPDSTFMTELGSESQFVGLLLAVGESGPRFDRPGERYPAAVAGKKDE